MAIIGTKLTAFTWPGVSIGHSNNNQRAVALLGYVAPSAGYATRIGVWARKPGGTTPRIYLAMYALDDDGTPITLLARTNRFDVVGGGADFSQAIAWTHPTLKGLPTAVRLVAGQRFAIATKVENASVEFATIVGTTTHFARDVGGTVAPTNPFNPTTTLPGLDIPAFYVDFTENLDPSAAITAPADESSVNVTSPTYTGTFTDPQDDPPIGDKMSAYALEVIRVADEVVMWGGAGAVFAASDAERESATFSRVHGGTALPTGSGPYEVRAKVFDDSGAGSEWSVAHSFSVNAAGQVYTADAGAPLAKEDGDPALLNWGGRWFHPTALAMSHVRVQVGIGDSVIKVGTLYDIPNVASSAWPGTAFSVPAANAGIGDLAPETYWYQIQGTATDGTLSPWSDPREFVINSPPTVPSNLQPPDGSVSTDLPFFEWNVRDPNTDDVYGVDDSSYLEFRRPNGTTFNVETYNYDADTGKGFYQALSSEFLSAVRGRYLWRVQGRDISAGVRGYSDFSGWHAIDYVAGPVVEILSPASGETVDTSVPNITWNVVSGSQERYRVRAYLADKANAIESSGDKTGSVEAFKIPAGWFKKGKDYDVDVTVWDGADNAGVSLRRQFSVDYSGPVELVNVQAAPYGNRFDAILGGLQEASSLLISFDMTNLAPGEFGGYGVTRRLATQEPEEAIKFPIIENPNQPRWLDHLAPANVPLVYAVTQFRRVSDAEVLESDPVEIAVQLTRRVPILCSAKNPGGLRISGMWIEGDNEGGSFTRDQFTEKTWGSGQKRIHNQPPQAYGAKRTNVTIIVKADERGNLYDHLDAIDDLIESGDPLLWSPPRPRGRMFCALEGDSKWKRAGIGRQSRTFDLIEIDWNEGRKV